MSILIEQKLCPELTGVVKALESQCSVGGVILFQIKTKTITNNIGGVESQTLVIDAKILKPESASKFVKYLNKLLKA